jgi:tRNA-specific 2-thiouridylase
MKKVFVGLSGGVDSSVSALLLKNAGYDVTGVFIRGWQPDWIPCTWKIDRISAMRTAAYLNIPFLTLDLEMQYKNKVVTYLLDEYSKGNTPNPDMLCNREIKFGDFLKWSLKNGADYVATGHYAQNIENNLYESADKQKDQSYFCHS